MYYGGIDIDAEGNIWFGWTRKGMMAEYFKGSILKLDGITWTTHYYYDIGLVTAIAIDSDNNKWFGWCDGHGGGLGVSKFNDTTWTPYTSSVGLAGDYVNAITIDKEGYKWFGTEGGVSKFDGTTWTTYTTADGLVDNHVTAIAIDAEGNIWFGTAAGVSKLSGDGRIVNISVSPVNQDVGFDAGSTEFNVTSNAPWTMSNDADWLTLSRTSLSVNATIIAKFTANSSTSPRVTTITIYGPGINTQYVTVTQSGAVSVPSYFDLKASIYPNPVKDNLIIKLDNALSTDISISVFDICGRRVMQRNFEHIDLDAEKTLDLSFMKSGLYFLEIKSETNSGVYKIIKE